MELSSNGRTAKNEFFLFKDVDLNSLTDTLKMKGLAELIIVVYFVYLIAWDFYFNIKVHPWLEKTIHVTVLLLLVFGACALDYLIRGY